MQCPPAMCINHWRENRPDILRKLALMCKWLNDVYIEHHHSVMARILKRIFPNNFSFSCIRWSSIFTSAVRGFWNTMSKVTFTQCPPASITAEPEDIYMDTQDVNFDERHGRLRKKDKSVTVIIPNAHGRGASSSTTRIEIKENMSEPLKQLYVWEDNTIQLEQVCGFLRDLLRNLDAPVVSVIDSPTPEQELATRRMNSYRPLILCKNHGSYCTSLFTTYLKNAREADNKLIELKNKTELFIFLDKHSVKDTLKPLLLRLRRRALRGDDLLKLSVNHSSSAMMSIDLGEEMDGILSFKS